MRELVEGAFSSVLSKLVVAMVTYIADGKMPSTTKLTIAGQLGRFPLGVSGVSAFGISPGTD